jgi:hypothetical protein
MQFAYDAAVIAGVDSSITRLYLATAMRYDEAWYVENLRVSQQSLFDAEEEALSCALPKLDEWMKSSGMARYVGAPIVSTERWNSFLSQLEVFIPPNVEEMEGVKTHPTLSRL